MLALKLLRGFFVRGRRSPQGLLGPHARAFDARSEGIYDSEEDVIYVRFTTSIPTSLPVE
ncbi:uncharacterized protein PHACADRAFT_251359 [Phanerochaete carnosa HHB-10118-sp]|uniref:Uncharacterized protein n=1 Tax=Phanerochaete carnosa (strain HHB-10118-sp) TaxID=650164 RepID=K5X465_PHACS|nr:uncharacterized protein PHACADRAFT_251359 [Phanerochaete carnosa HHB-10118-sp]EKM57627.1 hypothetical protein PHACADRAFT_251359 [Phanerochaete carnosa HHB-10118-sp]